MEDLGERLRGRSGVEWGTSRRMSDDYVRRAWVSGGPHPIKCFMSVGNNLQSTRPTLSKTHPLSVRLLSILRKVMGGKASHRSLRFENTICISDMYLSELDTLQSRGKNACSKNVSPFPG